MREPEHSMSTEMPREVSEQYEGEIEEMKQSEVRSPNAAVSKPEKDITVNTYIQSEGDSGTGALGDAPVPLQSLGYPIFTDAR
jgi:hypothetical protein